MKRKFIVFNGKRILANLLMISLVITMCLIASSNVIENILETSNQKRLLPIYSVETSDKKVALTFDCAWGADDIPNIIDILVKNNVKATFFTVGDWVKKYPDAVKNLYDAGMEIR